MQSVAPEVIERPRHLIHQPVAHQHADYEDDAEKVYLLADGSLNLQGYVARVHADMNVACLTGDDICRYLREVSEAFEGAVVGVLRILVVGGDLVGHTRHESMRDDHALLVHDEDIRDARDLYELVNDRLEGRIVPLDDQIDVRVGNAACDRPAVLQEIVGQLPIHGVDVKRGGRRHDEPN